MDWVCDGWGKLPAKIQRIADKVGALTAAEKRALVAVVRAKGGRRESDFVLQFDRHRKLRRAVTKLALDDLS